MVKGIRRVVTSHDRDGKAVIVIDGPAPNMQERKASNVVSTLLWVTDETPADMAGSGDRAQREIGVAPPPNGSAFRIVDFLPSSGRAVDNAEMLKELGLNPGSGPVRHATMHRTKSIDYAIVIEGEIDMFLDDSEVHLTAGDVIVQQGTNHAWVNNTDKPCRIAFVLIDGKEPPGWKGAGH